MSSLFRWTPDLAVGVGEIDRQHQELYRQVDRLVEALRAGHRREAVEPVLEFLETYVRHHFRAEEQWMAMHRYPGEAVHRAEHQAFMHDLEAMRQAWAKNGASPALAIDVQRRACGWLREHIGRTDRALGEFLAQRGDARG